MDALIAIKTRRSVRSYRADPVAASVIEDIVECGHLAATARNVQPWEFIVITSPQVRQQLARLIDTGRFLAEAPVCIAVFCRDSKYFLEDGCAAIQNMLVAARAHGLGTCWVAGEKKPYAETVAQILHVPSSHKLVGLVAVGHPTSNPEMPPKRPLREVLHHEHF
jgi:nitroreductase